jgi:hypothetical protein
MGPTLSKTLKIDMLFDVNGSNIVKKFENRHVLSFAWPNIVKKFENRYVL